MEQFNRLDRQWATYTQADAMRVGAQNPALLSAVQTEMRGSVQKILEIGCGEGRLARILADQFKAQVTAFDSSENYIRIALDEENKNPLGIMYSTNRASEFRLDETFDQAVAVMVLQYAADEKDLQRFFECARYHLQPGKQFASINFNPTFKAFGKQIGNRKFTKKDDRTITVHFLRPDGQEEFTADYRNFSYKDYENAAHAAGFEEIEWSVALPTHDALQTDGEQYWQSYIENPPYVLLQAR